VRQSSKRHAKTRGERGSTPLSLLNHVGRLNRMHAAADKTCRITAMLVFTDSMPPILPSVFFAGLVQSPSRLDRPSSKTERGTAPTVATDNCPPSAGVCSAGRVCSHAPLAQRLWSFSVTRLVPTRRIVSCAFNKARTCPSAVKYTETWIQLSTQRSKTAQIHRASAPSSTVKHAQKDAIGATGQPKLQNR
jgi:hypothetical protein